MHIFGEYLHRKISQLNLNFEETKRQTMKELSVKQLSTSKTFNLFSCHKNNRQKQ